MGEKKWLKSVLTFYLFIRDAIALSPDSWVKRQRYILHPFSTLLKSYILRLIIGDA